MSVLVSRFMRCRARRSHDVGRYRQRGEYPKSEGKGMKIDIDKLTEAELIDLNNRIVQRLRFLQEMRSHARMLDFSIGDRVEFQPDGHPLIVGILTRYNKKTVTVVTSSGQRWNVAPQFLRRASEKDVTPAANANVVLLRKD